MPIFGPPNIDQLRTQKDVRGLIKALSYPNDPKIRRQAALSLCALKEYQAVDVYILMLRDVSPNLRQAAVEALGAVGDARSVRPLISLMNDEQLEIRRAATKALGEVCIRLEDPTRGQGLIVARPEDTEEHDRALNALVEALQTHDAQVREAAANTLSFVGWQPHTEKGWGDFWAAKQQWSALIILGAPATASLINLLSDWDPTIRQHALSTLGVIANPHTASTLIDCFDDPDPAVRDSALDALHKLEKDGYTALLTIIQNAQADQNKRQVCIEALVQIGDTDSINALIHYLANPALDPGSRPELQKTTIKSLGSRNDIHGVLFLLYAYRTWLQQEGEGNPLFPLISQQLESIQDPMAIKAWIEVLRDKYHPFNEMSIQRLAALGSQASDPVLHDAAIDALVEYRMGQTGPLRHSAMQALEKLGWKPGYVSQAAGQVMPSTAPLHTE